MDIPEERGIPTGGRQASRKPLLQSGSALAHLPPDQACAGVTDGMGEGWGGSEVTPGQPPNSRGRCHAQRQDEQAED